MIKVIQANCRASEDIMTALMSAAVRAGAEVVLIQEPSVKKEEDKWKVNIRDGNYVYIYSGDNDRPYVLTAVRKDVVWKDYGGSRNAERVGIEIWKHSHNQHISSQGKTNGYDEYHARVGWESTQEMGVCRRLQQSP
jgi:hypothetical protein